MTLDRAIGIVMCLCDRATGKEQQALKLVLAAAEEVLENEEYN